LEEEHLVDEMILRDKQEKRYIQEEQKEMNETKMNEMKPMTERSIEKYIHPGLIGWQERYYKSLFGIDIDDERRKQICINYLEGLEWTLKYYTVGCADWRWSYKYDYPPLFCDLIKYIPLFDMDLIEQNTHKPVSSTTQLCYVLPKSSLDLLPPNIKARMLQTQLYDKEGTLMWAFCKYTWEAHVQLPEIDIDELERIIT
jgi:5'-3' exonuclease